MNRPWRMVAGIHLLLGTCTDRRRTLLSAQKTAQDREISVGVGVGVGLSQLSWSGLRESENSGELYWRIRKGLFKPVPALPMAIAQCRIQTEAMGWEDWGHPSSAPAKPHRGTLLSLRVRDLGDGPELQLCGSPGRPIVTNVKGQQKHKEDLSPPRCCHWTCLRLCNFWTWLGDGNCISDHLQVLGFTLWGQHLDCRQGLCSGANGTQCMCVWELGGGTGDRRIRSHDTL